MNENDIAIKNKKAYAIDVIKIVSGAILSLLLVAIVLIFRNSMAFQRGIYSPLDFTLLFLLLSGGLFSNGIKYLRNHKKMPDVMLTIYRNRFFVLGDEIDYDAVKSLNGKHEFGRTGTIIIVTDAATYKLYGVQQYANAINAISDIIAKNKQNPIQANSVQKTGV